MHTFTGSQIVRGGLDLYNDEQCLGRGECVRGVCECFSRQFSGDACEVEAAYRPDDIDYLTTLSASEYWLIHCFIAPNGCVKCTIVMHMYVMRACMAYGPDDIDYLTTLSTSEYWFMHAYVRYA